MVSANQEPPTTKQRAWLEKQGIPIPRSKQQCSLLISYILDEDLKYPNEAIADRIRRMRDYWPGAEVKFKLDLTDHVGTVIGIRMRSAAEFTAMQRAVLNPGPFQLVVECGGTEKNLSPSILTVLIPGNQKRLY